MVSSEREAKRARTSYAASETGSPNRSRTSTGGVPPRPASAQPFFGSRNHWSASEERCSDEEDAEPPRARFDEEANQVRTITEEDEREDTEGRTEADTLAGVTTRVLSLHSYRQRLAAAYHDSETRILSFLEDTEDSKAFDLALTVMEQVDPTVIITGSRSDEGLIEAIQRYCQEHDACMYHIRSYKDYSLGGAVARLSNLSMLSSRMPRQAASSASEGDDDAASRVESVDRWEALSEEERSRQALLTLGCFTNLEAHNAICAAGALLAFLQRQRAIGMEQEDLTMMRGVETLQLDRHMLISADSLSALQIFDEQDAASVHAIKQKEGLSLFGLLNTCRTPSGVSLLRQWLIRPLVNIEDIKARHHAVGVLSSSSNQASVTEMTKAMKRVKNLYRLLNVTRDGLADWATLKCIMDFLLAVIVIQKVVSELQGAETTEIYHKIMESIAADAFRALAAKMAEMIDWDASRDEKRTIIADGYDKQIDEWRNLQASLPEVLQKGAIRAQAELPEDFALELFCVSFPQLGYQVAIEGTSHEDISEHLPDDWHFQFSDDSMLYYRNAVTRELDEAIGDIHNKISDRSIDILDGLQQEFAKIDSEILRANHLVAELDCLMAFASASRDFMLVRPDMVADTAIKIQGGRHLLHELMTDVYVPNDTLLHGGQGLCSGEEGRSDSSIESLMILASSNGSGKTAYAKQVALICFMAQIGCFVPAQAATLGPVDKLFTRLQTRESAAKAASAFMIDLSQVSQALRGATASSLIILDEFGKGTTPEDGAGLLAGVVMHLLNRGSRCPITIVITHFHELFLQNVLQPDLPISLWQMKTSFDPRSDSEDEAVTYLYQLTPSVSTASMAFECAAKHGLGDDIIERARFVSRSLSKYELGAIVDSATMTDADKKELLEAETLARTFLKWDLQLNGAESLVQALEQMLVAAEETAGGDAGGMA